MSLSRGVLRFGVCAIGLSLVLLRGGGIVTGAPRCYLELYVDPEGVTGCPEYFGPGGGVDPNAKLIDLVQFITAMEHALADEASIDGLDATLNVAEPYYLTSQPQMESTSEISIFQDEVEVAAGFSSVIAHSTTGDVDLVIELTEAGVTRTLEQLVSLDDGVLTTWGTMTVDDGVNPPVILDGGWIYSVADGLLLDPDADAGFVDAAAAMIHVPDVGGRSFSLGSIVSWIGNVATMGINYILDIFTPHTPPTSCTGPVIYDGAGQSCEGVDIPCGEDLDDMCESLDGLTGVSVAFKKCMKGRCGCGGSNHRRARISCDVETDCGPCIPQNSLGCSLAGSRIWYCNDTLIACECVWTVFHEMAHGCGALDFTGTADGVGTWFYNECGAISP